MPGIWKDFRPLTGRKSFRHVRADAVLQFGIRPDMPDVWKDFRPLTGRKSFRHVRTDAVLQFRIRPDMPGVCPLHLNKFLNT
jgi:hypothetical protein